MTLKTENPRNGLKAISAFFKLQRTPRSKRQEFDYVFEHGQLWIVNNLSGASWSVVDAEGDLTVNGFDFEQIDEGRED